MSEDDTDKAASWCPNALRLKPKQSHHLIVTRVVEQMFTQPEETTNLMTDCLTWGVLQVGHVNFGIDQTHVTRDKWKRFWSARTIPTKQHHGVLTL